MQPFETMLSRFGSRLVMNLRPQFRQVRLSPVGTYHWRPYAFHAAVAVGEKSLGLSLDEQEPFEELCQSITPTSVIISGQQAGFPIRCQMRLFAPFLPRDAAASGTPAIYVDVCLKAFTDVSGTLRLGPQAPSPQPLTGEGFIGYVWEDDFDAHEEKFHEKLAFVRLHDQGAAPAAGQAGLAPGPFELPFHLEAGKQERFRFVLASCVTAPILDIRGQQAQLDYALRLPDMPSVIDAAIAERDRCERIATLFDATLLGGSLGLAAQNLASLAFHSYVANTWWARQADGRPWYSVWEGNCGYHSTIDVEYNQAVFYLWYWPELLAMLLEQWPTFKDSPGYLPHDMGVWHRVAGKEYGHAMKVEENTNYLLLLFAYWRWTGDLAMVRRQWPLVQELLEFFEECDSGGTGWCDQGAANTLDSGSFVVQLSCRQTYQAIRILCCLEGAILAAKALGGEHNVTAYRGFIEYARGRQELIGKTLREKAWVGDHYAISLDERIRGHNTYGMMAGNGLVFPFLTGRWLPDLDWMRIRQDMQTGWRETRRQYGCAMTAIDNTGWISQNLFRDITGFYLGLDLEGLCIGYWEYELWANRRHSNCFKDGFPPEITTLNYYPRGIAAFGLMPAQAALSYDHVERVLHVCPSRPVSLALPWAADWDNGRMPWLLVDINGTWSSENQDLLEGIEVSVSNREWLGDLSLSPAGEATPAQAGPADAPDRFDFFWGQGTLTGRHGLWGAGEAAGRQAFQVVARWQRNSGGDDLQAGDFGLDIPPGWSCVPLDAPHFDQLERAGLNVYQCRWAVRIAPSHDWSKPATITGTLRVSTGACHSAQLLVYADPRTDLSGQGDIQWEAGIGAPEIGA